MNKLILSLSLISLTTFASDTLTGSVMIGGKKIPVSVDTNINTGKKVTIGTKTFKIVRINDSNIAAQAGDMAVEVYIGDAFTQGILNMSKGEIAGNLGLSNGSEIKCSKKSKGFLTITSELGISKGNCIN